MKKFTLFLLMFCMLGTALAQDAGLQIVVSEPNSDNPVSKVEYIRHQFSKDVSVTLPQESIIIKSDDANVEYKITNGMGYGPNAIFYLEKVAGASKDENGKDENGKEDDVVTYISEVGTYTYTIPAGVITSTDGEVFPETTFTFSISEPFSFEVTFPGPNGTDKLEKIELTFNKKVANVQMPASGLCVVDNYWTPVSNIKSDVIVSDDKMSVTLELESPITTPGNYNIDIYNGIFTSEDGAKNDYMSVLLKVVDTTPSFSTNYKDGDKVQEIGDLEITFNNVKEVKLVEGADNVVVYIPGGSDVTGSATLADNKITVKFDEEFTEEGDYTFVIPAGMFTMDGVENEFCEIRVELYTFTVTPLEILGVYPGEATVEQLQTVVIKFNQKVSLSFDENWQQISRVIKLTSEDKEYTLTYNSNSSLSDQLEYLVNAEWVGNEYKSTPITAAGKYTLDFSEIIVDYAAEEYIDEYGYPNTKWHMMNHKCEGTYTWVITDDTAVDNVEVEGGEQTIFDLTGRRVKNITNAGIYIVNGKKVIVK